MYDGSIDEEPIGRRIARLRRKRGLSQRELAALLSRSTSWVSAVERGVRNIDRVSVRRDLCQALHVPLSELVSQTTEAAPGRRQPSVAERLTVAIVTAASQTAIKDTATASGSLDDIDSKLVTIDRLWASALLLEAADLLARVIPPIEQVTATATRTTSHVATLTVRTYRAAAEILSELGEHVIALMAAERATRTAIGSTVSATPSAVTTVCVLRRAGRYHEATALAMTTITAVTPRARGGRPAAIAARGALLLELAAAYADEHDAHDAERAYEYLEQARADATKLGSDGTYDGILFGPTAIGLREAALDLRFGHIEHAKNVLDALDMTGKSKLQRVRYWVLRCRVEAELGNTAAAIEAADTACDLAPAIANDPALHRVVSKLLATHTKHQGDVRTLGRRLGAL